MGPPPHFHVKPSVVERALKLWTVTLKALLAAGLTEEGVPEATTTLVQQLHAALVAEEEAAVAVMAAVALLPYEQLQTLQVCVAWLPLLLVDGPCKTCDGPLAFETLTSQGCLQDASKLLVLAIADGAG